MQDGRLKQQVVGSREDRSCSLPIICGTLDALIFPFLLIQKDYFWNHLTLLVKKKVSPRGTESEGLYHWSHSYLLFQWPPDCPPPPLTSSPLLFLPPLNNHNTNSLHATYCCVYDAHLFPSFLSEITNQPPSVCLPTCPHSAARSAKSLCIVIIPYYLPASNNSEISLFQPGRYSHSWCMFFQSALLQRKTPQEYCFLSAGPHTPLQNST